MQLSIPHMMAQGLCPGSAAAQKANWLLPETSNQGKALREPLHKLQVDDPGGTLRQMWMSARREFEWVIR